MPNQKISKNQLKDVFQKNKKQHFRKFLKKSSTWSFSTKLKQNETQKFLRLYKPLSLSFLKKNFHETFSESDFFPHKKPFMQFWILPLLGASFLSLLTLDQEKNVTKQLKKFPNFGTFLQQNSQTSLTDFPTNAVNSNSKLSFVHPKINTVNFTLNKTKQFLVSNDSSFGATYVPKKLHEESFENRMGETKDLEQLCMFYLNLTNQHLNTSIPNFELPVQNHQSFFEKNLLQPWYLKKSNFDWIWYSLNMDFPNSSMEAKNFQTKFPQKFNNLTFYSTTKNFNVQNAMNDKFYSIILNNPTLSYNQASVLFDQWLNHFRLNSSVPEIFKNSGLIRQKETFLNTNNFQDFSENFVETLEKLNKFETLYKTNKEQNKNVVFYFSNFLDFLTNNEKKLKETFLQIQHHENQNFKFLNGNNENLVQNDKIVLQQFQQSLKKDFVNILLQNYLKEISNKTVYGQKFLKVSNIENLSAISSTNPVLNSDRQFQHVFNSTVFLKMNKNKLFKNSNLKTFSEKYKFLHNLQTKTSAERFQYLNKVSKITSSLENNFKQTTHDLILLNSWNKLLLDKNSTLYSTFGKNFNETSTNFPSFKFIQEVALYRQFKNLSKKLLNFPTFQVLTNNLNFSEMANPSEQKEKRVFQTILKYNTPILLSSMKQKDLLEKNLSFNFNKNVQSTALGKRNQSNLFEIRSKSNLLSSSFIVSSKHVDVSMKKKNQILKFNKTKNENKFFLLDKNKQNLVKNFILEQRNFLKLFSQEKLFKNQNFNLQTEFLNSSKPKQFSISKNFQTQKNQEIYEVKAYGQNKFQTYKKALKQKNFLNLQFKPMQFEKRKAEKIFRTYSSIKKGTAKKFPFDKIRNPKISFNEISPILQKLKKRVKQKNAVSKAFQTNWISISPKNPTITKQSGFATQYSSEFLNKNFFHDSKNLKNYETLFSMKNNKLHLQTSFESRNFLNRLGSLNFLKRVDFLDNETDLKRLEKKKLLQKKRRLRKLKLENRRRKKRKRFYPRPAYLRFELYSKFLQKRHPIVGKRKFSQRNMQFFKNQKFNGLKKTKAPSHVQFQNIQQKIYRQNKNTWEKHSKPHFQMEKSNFKRLSFILTKPSYHQKEFYKISNETLTEFERLCWKSYWLRSNLKPYVRRIQTNLKTMQQYETLKNSEKTLFNVLKNFTKQISSSSFGLVEKTFVESQNSFKNMTPVYVNLKQTLESPFFENPSNLLFKSFENKAEYENLLYERITEQIKNVKSQLNVDGQNQPRSYKAGRQKIEKPIKKSMFDSLNALQNNSFEPNIHGFFMDSILNNSGVKPLGDLPTLRVLWACHKTNIFTYKENNFSKQIWSVYKQREQTKNNKTRKFLSKIVRFSNFKTKNMDSLSQFKTKHAAKKIQTFGGFVYGKNYPIYVRNLKFQLQKTPFLKNSIFKEKNQSKFIFEENPEMDFSLNKDNKQWFETNLENKLQKRVIHFWWSSGFNSLNEKKIPLFMFSPVMFSNFPMYISQNLNKSLAEKNLFMGQYLSDWNLASFNLKDSFELHLNKTIITTSFWMCCCLLHVAILFTLIRIPEIRSLVKFQCLILTKFANAYLIGLFSLYDLLQNYKTKVTFLFEKTAFVSGIHPKESNFTFSSLETPSKNHLFLDKNNFKANSFQVKNVKFVASNLTHLNALTVVEKGWIQSTLTLNFDYRDVLTFFGKNSKYMDKNFENIPIKNLHTILTTAIHPVFAQTESFKKQNDKQFLQSWFRSSSTGFVWYCFPKTFDQTMFFKTKQTYLKKLKEKTVSNPMELFQDSSEIKKGNADRLLVKEKNAFSSKLESNFEIQYILSLAVLSLSKLTLSIFYGSFEFLYKIVLKGIDIMESILLLFYKFLEKPAEVMVAMIAEIFLIEWSSDLTTYVPEAFDRQTWTSFKKFSRSARFLGSLPFGFVIQRFLLNTTENFYSWMVKPDADLISRQKKGVIFWDIWAEILIQAAEKYKMNLSSLTTVKDEQELLIENLLEEKQIPKVEKNKLEKNKFAENSDLKKTKEKNEAAFLNSKQFKQSLSKMKPLTKFLQEYPSNPSLQNSKNLNLRTFHKKQTSKTIFNFENQFFLNNIFKMESNFAMDLFKANVSIDPWKRWSVNQYLTTQGRDTDLFMDIHPPKSFAHVRFLKTYLPAQEILGSIVCEIYSGLFSNKVSKNVLIVGAPGAAKSFFIQALAGETELKIVTDNAHRYAFVSGGVPIGMKLLRDVFDSLALHTPCLFLLEDIHIIGERRPMLISDDEISKTKDVTFGAEQEEVHEKNRLLYQLSRHSLSHYKRPYKGDFSASIPTNHFCYDLFLGVQPPRKRSSDLTAKSPFPLIRIEKVLKNQESFHANNVESQNSSTQQNLLSVLQVSMEQVFAPPATSPFNILLMKEQKKLKPKKIVKEMPWSGLSYDQLMLISKSNYSVRVKVALLAESAMTNLSSKLDMITDLLVIIDSVRSNRGFVVFATTHLPALLDPALRRPGRFDETLSLPLLPNLMTRFEIFKTSLASYTKTTDFLDLSLWTSKQKQNENEISASISKSLLLLLNTKNFPKRNMYSNLFEYPIFSNFFNDYSIYSISQAFQTSIQQNSLLLNTTKFQKLLTENRQSQMPQKTLQKSIQKETLWTLLKGKNQNPIFCGNDKLNYVSLSYAQAGQFLMEALILHDQTTYSSKFLMASNAIPEFDSTEHSVFQMLYSSKAEANNTLLKLFAGKIAEFFVFNTSSSFANPFQFENTVKSLEKEKFENFQENKFTKEQQNQILKKKNRGFTNASFLPTNPSQAALFENVQNFQGYWQSAVCFLDSFVQKRYLYNKNSIVSKMLFFEDSTPLRDVPSPPNSSILMPSKKFENYKRTLKDFIQKPMLTINEKLQSHQKQRFLKLLYNIPVQTSFKTVSNSSYSSSKFHQTSSTTFYNSFKELGYLDLMTLKPTSSYLLYKNRFMTRHRFSFLNQWWNGQLAEHNVETTYLSHVDWRSMFVQSLGDIVIDFPDADQYYNPRQKRWYLHSQSWAYWCDFEKNYRTQISQHYILQSFTKTSNILNQNREYFDYLAFSFLRYHQLKEIDFLQSLSRFYKTHEF